MFAVVNSFLTKRSPLRPLGGEAEVHRAITRSLMLQDGSHSHADSPGRAGDSRRGWHSPARARARRIAIVPRAGSRLERNLPRMQPDRGARTTTMVSKTIRKRYNGQYDVSREAGCRDAAHRRDARVNLRIPAPQKRRDLRDPIKNARPSSAFPGTEGKLYRAALT